MNQGQLLQAFASPHKRLDRLSKNKCDREWNRVIVIITTGNRVSLYTRNMYSPNGSDASCASTHQSNGSANHGYKHQRQMYIQIWSKKHIPISSTSFSPHSHSLSIPQNLPTSPPPERAFLSKNGALHIGSSHTTCIAAILRQLNLCGHRSGLYTTT